IPEEKKDLVFKKFGQYISSLKQQKGTTGIGLTFCKMAIESHGGSIDFYTKEGEGTTFYFKLPQGTNIKSSLRKGNNSFYNSFQNKYNEFFNETEKQILKGTTERLNKLKPYQIGEIKKVLTETEQKNPKIKSWVEEIKKAIFNSDKNYYRYLIDMV
nr:ATP-binding protein [Prolixibacteraceae bacterium]